MTMRGKQRFNEDRGMSYLQDDKARLRRLRAREAITLAMQSRWEEAGEAYKRARDRAPHNQIARKTLARLAILKEAEAPVDRHRVAPHLFLEETGRAGVVDLAHTAVPEVLARLAAGEQVFLNGGGG